MLAVNIQGEKVIPYIVYKGKISSSGFLVKELKKGLVILRMLK
jgi:hypothetical protein